MRASLTIGGIEVALSTPAGALEAAVAERYAPFLGAVEAPVCSLALEPSGGSEVPSEPGAALVERVGDTNFRVTHGHLVGSFDLAGHGGAQIKANALALDHALRLMFGLLAPCHDALVVRAASVMGDDGVHVFLEASETVGQARLTLPRPVLSDNFVVVRREKGGWLAASTPFGAAYKRSAPRDGILSCIWALRSCDSTVPAAADLSDAQRFLGRRVFLPTADSEIRRTALALAESLLNEVPFSDGLRFSPSAWAEIDAAGNLPASRF